MRRLWRWCVARVRTWLGDIRQCDHANLKARSFDRACGKLIKSREREYSLDAENIGLRRRVEELEVESRLAETQLEGYALAHRNLLEMLKAETSAHVRQRIVMESGAPPPIMPDDDIE